jgi:methanogenic corrinoid protein MtbC1
MEGTIAMLRKHVPRELAPKAYIIGGRVDALVCEETDADFWTKDAMDGVRLSQSIMAQQAIPGRPNPS